MAYFLQFGQSLPERKQLTAPQSCSELGAIGNIMETVKLSHNATAAVVPLPNAPRTSGGLGLKLAWNFRFLLLPGLTGGLAALSVLLCLLVWEPVYRLAPLPKNRITGFDYHTADLEAHNRQALPPSLDKSKTETTPKLLPLAQRQRKYWPLVRRLARAKGLDPALVMAVVQTESGFIPHATSPKGASGLMQLVPETAAQMGLEDPFDPAQNLEAGVAYLARLKKRFKDDLVLTLAAYNAGPTKVESLGAVPNHSETKAYIEKVLRKIDFFRNRFQSLAKK